MEQIKVAILGGAGFVAVIAAEAAPDGKAAGTDDGEWDDRECHYSAASASSPPPSSSAEHCCITALARAIALVR